MTKTTLTVETMSLEELEKRTQRAQALIAELDGILPGLTTLTEEDRRGSDGKLKNGEEEALRAVLACVDENPAPFEVLADQDGGFDPQTFESDLLADRLTRRELLAQVATALDARSTQLADTLLHLGEQSKPPILAAYHIAKPLAAASAKLRATLAPALDFYGRIARRSAESRATHKSSPAPSK